MHTCIESPGVAPCRKANASRLHYRTLGSSVIVPHAFRGDCERSSSRFNGVFACTSPTLAVRPDEISEVSSKPILLAPSFSCRPDGGICLAGGSASSCCCLPFGCLWAKTIGRRIQQPDCMPKLLAVAVTEEPRHSERSAAHSVLVMIDEPRVQRVAAQQFGNRFGS